MSTKLSWISINLIALFFMVMFAGTALAEDGKKTIEGTVTEFYEIVVDENESYDIGESEAGEKIMEHVGEKVIVTGTIEVDEEMETKTIIIESFKVVQETEE